MYKMFKKKKGMELGGLYNFILTLVMIGMLLGLSFVLLGKLGGSSGMTDTAGDAINATTTALTEIPNTWLGLIVVFVIIIILMGLFIRGLGGVGQGRA